MDNRSSFRGDNRDQASVVKKWETICSTNLKDEWNILEIQNMLTRDIKPMSEGNYSNCITGAIVIVRSASSDLNKSFLVVSRVNLVRNSVRRVVNAIAGEIQCDTARNEFG